MKYFAFVGILIVLALTSYMLLDSRGTMEVDKGMDITSSGKIYYVAIGDSYTIGEGVAEAETYPVLLANHLQDEGVDIELVANPAVTGYTTQDAISYELPVLEASNANFVTVLLGANDVLSKDARAFQRNYALLLDEIQEKLPDKDMVILLTIPDFSVTPYAKTFGYTQEEIRDAIIAFNAVIKAEASERQLKAVDLFSLSGGLEGNPEMLVSDGLHPSGKQYMLWEKELFPVVYEMLSE